MDPDLIVPDPTRSIRDGAIEPWASGMNKGEGWTADFVESLAAAFKIDLDAPYEKLTRASATLMYGSGARRSPSSGARAAATRWSGRAWSTS